MLTSAQQQTLAIITRHLAMTGSPVRRFQGEPQQDGAVGFVFITAYGGVVEYRIAADGAASDRITHR